LVGSDQVITLSDMSIESKIKYTNGVLQTDHNDSNNLILSSRYTWYTFIPQCLFEQIIRPANVYFLCIGCLQCIGPVSTTEGFPVIIMPLTVVFCVAMAKLGWEDYKRHVSDEAENNKTYLKISMASGESEHPELSEIVADDKALVTRTKCCDIKVGDIIFVKEGQTIPADMVLIGTAAKSREERPATFCHIETSNIDGETNLKVRMIPEILNSVESCLFDLDGDKRGTQILESCSKGFDSLWKNYDMSITVSEATGDLDNWKGSQAKISVGKKRETVQLSMENLLVRGAVLQNTKYIFGVVVYTGRECKVFKNSEQSKAPGKSSRFEKTMNNIIFLMAMLLCCLCLIMMISTFGWTKENNPDAWYLLMNKVKPIDFAGIRFFTWIIVFSQLVPVSLLVSLEMTRMFKAK